MLGFGVGTLVNRLAPSRRVLTECGPAVTYVLTGTGVWSSALRYGDPGASAEAAEELESLGYSALWIPDIGGEVFDAVGNQRRGRCVFALRSHMNDRSKGRPPSSEGRR